METLNLSNTSVSDLKPFLPAKSLDLDRRHTLNPNFRQGFLNLIKIEGLDDCFNFFMGAEG